MVAANGRDEALAVGVEAAHRQFVSELGEGRGAPLDDRQPHQLGGLPNEGGSVCWEPGGARLAIVSPPEDEQFGVVSVAGLEVSHARPPEMPKGA